MVKGKSGRMYAKATNAETYLSVSETNDFKKINLRWLKKVHNALYKTNAMQVYLKKLVSN